MKSPVTRLMWIDSQYVVNPPLCKTGAHKGLVSIITEDSDQAKQGFVGRK